MYIAVLYSDDSLSVSYTPREFMELLEQYIEKDGMKVSQAMSKIMADLKKLSQQA
jgi:hypothetical protein